MYGEAINIPFLFPKKEANYLSLFPDGNIAALAPYNVSRAAGSFLSHPMPLHRTGKNKRAECRGKRMICGRNIFFWYMGRMIPILSQNPKIYSGIIVPRKRM
jgi:hypothetical protein